MKRRTKALIIIGSVVTMLWLVIRITGALQYYKIPSPTNEPAIKPGDHVLVSNLKKPLSKCFIVITSSYADSLNSIYLQDYGPGTRYLYRLCALPGDLVEMKQGVLFVNGKNFDQELDLKNQFKLSAKEFETIVEDQDKLVAADVNFYPNGDSIIVTMDKQMIKKYQQKLNLTPYIITDTSHGPFKWLDKNSTWTADNFGPLKIPADCYFGLGDNRHNAMDARYFGFIKKEDIKGVVLNK